MRAGAALVMLGVLVAPLAAQQRDTTRADTTRVDTTRAVRLQTQVITGTRLSAVDERTPVQVDQIDLRSVPTAPASAAKAIANLPGVSLSDDQGTRTQPTLNLRGFTLSPVVGVPQGVSVFLDGVRINEPDAQEVNFDLIPMDAVRSAELVRGPDVLFGKNTLAGALLLFTRRGGPTPVVEGEVEGGAFGYRGARVTASGSARGLDGFFLANGSDEDGYRVDAGARTRMLFANVGRKRDSSDVGLTVLYAHDRLKEAGSLPESWLVVDRRANYTEGDFFEPNLLHLALRGERSLRGGRLRGNIFGRRNDIEQFNVNLDSPNSRSFTLNRSGGGAAELSVPVSLAGLPLALTIGTEYSRNDVHYRIYNEATPGNPVDSAACDPASGLCTDARVNEDDAALYAQGLLQLGSRLSLTAAARGDYVRVPFRDLRDPANGATHTFTRLSPKVGANYQFSDAFRGYVAVSSGFRAPATLELACADETAPCTLPFALGNDPPLRPVTVLNYESGIDWDVTHALSLDLVGYHADVHDDIAFVASTRTEGFFQNVARTRRQGVEASAKLALPAGFAAIGSYTYLDATYQSTVVLASATPDTARPGDRFPLSPAHHASLAVQYTRVFPSLVLEGVITTRLVSGQFVRGDDANRLPPVPGYTLTDLRLSLEGAHLGVSAFVSNLFDRNYVTYGIYSDNTLGPLGGGPALPQPERWLTPGYPLTLTVSLTVKR